MRGTATDGGTSCSLRARAAPIEFAFETLSEIAQRSTRWSVVYDLGQRRIEFRTDKNKSRRWISLGDLEFSCSMAVLAMDLNGRGEGDVMSDLAPLEESKNLKVIRTSYRKTSFMKRTEDAVAKRVSRLAYGAQCAR